MLNSMPIPGALHMNVVISTSGGTTISHVLKSPQNSIGLQYHAEYCYEPKDYHRHGPAPLPLYDWHTTTLHP